MVLLHGLGSNEEDLMQVGELLEERFTVISLRAPLVSSYGGYAWFQIEWTANGIRYDAAEAAAAISKVQKVLEEIQDQTGVRRERFIVGGFSQGSMISLGATLAAPTVVGGLLFMSGQMVPELEAMGKPNSLVGLRALVQHGLQDEVLPASGGRETKSFLERLGATVEFHEYKMGHAISQESFTHIIGWLGKFS